MPYTYKLKNKKKIDFSQSEYVMRLYKNSGTSGTGSQVAAWSISISDLKSKFSETRTGISDNAKVKILLEWAD